MGTIPLAVCSSNGPYWVECNVGATKPEEYGYYFWWGDTVGYKRNASDDGWVSVKDGAEFSFSSENCPTYNKDNTQLQSDGYIDATDNLAAAVKGKRKESGFWGGGAAVPAIWRNSPLILEGSV